MGLLPSPLQCVSTERREEEHIMQRLGIVLALPSLLLALPMAALLCLAQCPIDKNSLFSECLIPWLV